MSTLSITTSAMVLRKRKDPPGTGILHLSSSPSPSYETYSESEYESGFISDSPTIATSSNTKTVSANARHFPCTFGSCSKIYTKASRLAEHERSHTGDRPFVCAQCSKSYLRESHLQAHARSHLPYSARPFVCESSGCHKRFWTTQHLRIHMELHNGEKPFKCTKESCAAAFTKHHQLREHLCIVHAPPGTKPYVCERAECTKSFATNQKLRTHMKTHNEKRYTCAHPSCLTMVTTSPVYYATWTALQHHVRTAHPPTCPYPACGGKLFTTQKGLRAHLKIHEQRDMEEGLRDLDSEDESHEPPRKKRRGGEVGRDWICDVDGCTKDFKSKKALTNHRNVNHLGRRDFVCPHASCGRAFAYKHILQRHIAKLHASGSDASDESDYSDKEISQEKRTTARSSTLDIDDITGKSYSLRSKQLIARTDMLRCPHPGLQGLIADAQPPAGSSKGCEYVFSRAYDLRRHLQSEHALIVNKDTVDEWVKSAKIAKTSSS